MFTFNNGIPAAGNNPSNDQPIMLSNNQSNQSIWAVDHVGFNANSGGTHLQSTYSSKNVPGAQTDPQSVVYTNSGTASSVAELFYRNQNGILLLSSLKAFGVFTTQNFAGVIPITMGQNVSSITAGANGITYTIVLTSGVITGTAVVVFPVISNSVSVTWSYALNTLTLGIPLSGTTSKLLSFAILQV
jgi:hypothetical protein